MSYRNDAAQWMTSEILARLRL